MKTIFKIILSLCVVLAVYACKNAEETKEYQNQTSEPIIASDESILSSSAAVENKENNRKFVRTADLKFKVKNVYKSTSKVEDAVSKFGGFVTYTNLQSTISYEDKTKISIDSSLVSTHYKVDNSLIIRVPNTQLDTLLKSMAKQIDFLHHRIIKADDVTLQLLSNKMETKRSNETENRMSKDIDNKGKKLNQIIDAEVKLDDKKAQKDKTILNNLSLKDQINFSTLTVYIYQDETIRQEIVVNEKNRNAYQPNIGIQIWDSIKSGWFILVEILLFLIRFWPLFLLGIGCYFGYKKYVK